MTANRTSSAFRKTAIGPWARNVYRVNDTANRVVRMSVLNAMAGKHKLAFLEMKASISP
jgi:hypothetical protein